MKPTNGTPITADAVQEGLGSIDFSAAELQQFVESLGTPHPSVMRLRRGIEPSEFTFATEPIDWYRLGHRVVEPTIRPSKTLSYVTGDFYLQDAGSLLALAACRADSDQLRDEEHGLLVCDLCASPGGKASALLEALGDTGFLLANEPIRSRLAPLTYNLMRVGSDRFAVCSMDPEKLCQRLPGIFDLVLVDAPCSGQAMISRGGQTAASLSQRQIAHSAARQERILSAAHKLLRTGGQLVYSTCTFTQAENEDQITRLIKDGIAEPMQREELASYRSEIGPDGCYRLWPHRNDCAGSFAASLMVLGSDPHAKVARSWKRGKGEKSPAPLDSFFQSTKEKVRLKQRENVVFGWPSDAPNWVDDLAVAGPEILHRTGQTWKPAHAAAMRRVDRFAAAQSLEVNVADAIAFAKGGPIDCSDKGWHVVLHGGKPLGWIKASRGIGKNQLPAAAKVSGDLS